jgi:hypothetical protein
MQYRLDVCVCVRGEDGGLKFGKYAKNEELCKNTYCSLHTPAGRVPATKCFERDREKPSSFIELHFCNYFNKVQ